MILRSSPTSPFGRMVKLAIAMLGMQHDIEIVMADTLDASDTIRAQNPLGKIPALILDDGTVLYDSRVILEYLDFLAGGGRLIPTPSPERFNILTRQALAAGLIDAAILQVYEGRFRADAAKHEPKWLAHQQGKVDRALVAFETTLPQGSRTIVDIALACALGFLDLRFAGNWRRDHPRLVAWLDAFAAELPAFEATRFKG